MGRFDAYDRVKYGNENAPMPKLQGSSSGMRPCPVGDKRIPKMRELPKDLPRYEYPQLGTGKAAIRFDQDEGLLMENDLVCDIIPEYSPDGVTAIKPCGIKYKVGTLVPCNSECYGVCLNNYIDSNRLLITKEILEYRKTAEKAEKI